MKLRTKLVLLVVGAAARFLLSIGLYFALQSSIEPMQKEAGYLTALSEATADLQVATGRLLTGPLAAQMDEYHRASEKYDEAQDNTKKIVLLRKANDQLADALKGVDNLGDLNANRKSAVDSVLGDLTDEAKDAGFNLTANTWGGFYQSASSKILKNSTEVTYSLVSLCNVLASFNDGLAATRSVIEKRIGIVDTEISKIRDQSSLAGVVVILLSVIVAVVLSLLTARSITRAMSSLSSTVAQVASGDLRVRFASSRKDELGVLGRDINGLLDSLTAAFRRIQAGSAENIEVKDQLAASVSTATASAVEIEANSSSILGQLKKSDEKIQASELDLNGVVLLLDAFHIRLGTQGQGVVDASRAVTELAQGIGRISDLSDQNRQAVEALLAESDRGREVFDRSFAKVAEINDSVAAIQDLVGAIAEIAGQTNILALNAAIEAAHAGDAGKGFAVVADEISKLAAASASSSAQIAETIEEVVAKIREAGATRQETIDAFNAIGTQIGTVSDRGKGIYNEAGRMNQGTHRIREVMETLSSGADDTIKEADRIGVVTGKLGEVLGQVGRISREVVSNIGEISQGLTEISRTILEVSTQADRLGRVGENLDHAVNAFQTETSETPETVVEELLPE